MNKLIVLLGVLLIAGLVFAVQAGVNFSLEQFSNADIENYDFELTNEGWTTTSDAYILTVGIITAEKTFDDNGDWNGMLTIQKYVEYPYWKERYKNCRTGISPYTYEQDTGEVDEFGQPIFETIKDSSKSGCIIQAKENIKSRVIADRERERDKLQEWQEEANDLLSQYDSEWVTPPTITNEELN